MANVRHTYIHTHTHTQPIAYAEPLTRSTDDIPVYCRSKCVYSLPRNVVNVADV